MVFQLCWHISCTVTPLFININFDLYNAGADLGFREGGVGVEIDARAKRASENFG